MRSYQRASLLLLLLSLGCSKGQRMAPVSGRILMDHRPLANADVRFYPSEGKNLPYSVGETDDQGNYTLDLAAGRGGEGAIVGEHRVTISIDERKLRKPLGPKGPRELVPRKYNRNTTLTCTVPPEGKQDADFDLKSK
jgi:hypothetical protein